VPRANKKPKPQPNNRGRNPQCREGTDDFKKKVKNKRGCQREKKRFHPALQGEKKRVGGGENRKGRGKGRQKKVKKKKHSVKTGAAGSETPSPPKNPDLKNQRGRIGEKSTKGGGAKKKASSQDGTYAKAASCPGRPMNKKSLVSGGRWKELRRPWKGEQIPSTNSEKVIEKKKEKESKGEDRGVKELQMGISPV